MALFSNSTGNEKFVVQLTRLGFPGVRIGCIDKASARWRWFDFGRGEASVEENREMWQQRLNEMQPTYDTNRDSTYVTVPDSWK
jgi:hypothetical protein